MKTSKRILCFSVLAGIVSGIVSVALIALINAALADTPELKISSLALAFGGLCLVRFLTGFASQGLLLHLSQGAIFNLRTTLSRKILSTSLRSLEEIGSHRLFAALTDDVLVISNAFVSVPLLITSIAIVGGCFIYLAWLSWMVVLAVVVCVVLWAISYGLVLNLAINYLELAREQTDM